ncbi:MAG: DUF1566 domain-containing protein [Burkholderiales bacterium]|nr:DUF1566 domain-containing protein [Burkholderiales bacterium]
MQRCPRVVLALVFTAALPAVAQDAPRLELGDDGRELRDAGAGLSWSRCVEGMRWTGRHCEGEPTLVTHKEALALARARSDADSRPWRLPRVQEFKRLGEHLGRAPNAAQLAPDVPRGWYWTATVRIETEAVNPYSYGNVQKGATERQVDRLAPQAGWSLEQPGGAVRESPKRDKLLVRLVRALPP